MSKINNYIPISSQYSIICNPELNKLKQNFSGDLSIIYFTEYFNSSTSLTHFLKNSVLKKVAVITTNHAFLKDSKISFYPTINYRLLKSLTNNILIIVDLNNNFKYIKFIIANLKKLIFLSQKYNITISQKSSDSLLLCTLFDNNSIYSQDFTNCLKALLISNKQKQTEFIYDTTCDYLDNQFIHCNLCDFKNDKCIANRTNNTPEKNMGCCYSFEYSSFFNINAIKNIQLCRHLVNRTCDTKNISCKLFTCDYLKKNKIKFNSHKILLLECFLNKKQHHIIQSNFFRTREDILIKLEEKNYDLYLWYFCLKKYRIQ